MEQKQKCRTWFLKSHQNDGTAVDFGICTGQGTFWHLDQTEISNFENIHILVMLYEHIG